MRAAVATQPRTATGRAGRAVLLGAAALLSAAWPAAPPRPLDVAPLQVDCRVEAGRLRAAVDLLPAIDAELAQALGSGLAHTLRLTVTALDATGRAAAAAQRDVDVRLDVWTEVFTMTSREPDGTASSRLAPGWLAAHDLLARPDPFDLGPLAGLPERFTIEARIELDPVTGRQLEKTRQELARPAGARSLLGTLAAVLLRAPPPIVERYRSAVLTRSALVAP
jgi:hypothetical protein